MAACNPDIISLCNTVDMTEGIQRCGTNFAFQVRAWVRRRGARGWHAGMLACWRE